MTLIAFTLPNIDRTIVFGNYESYYTQNCSYK